MSTGLSHRAVLVPSIRVLWQHAGRLERPKRGRDETSWAKEDLNPQSPRPPTMMTQTLFDVSIENGTF